TVDGTIDLAADMPQSTARWLTVSGGMTLNGTVLLGSDQGGRNGLLTFGGTQTLGGTGSVVVGQSSTGSTFGPGFNSFATLTIGPGITFHGGTAGIGTTHATVINEGTLLPSGFGPGNTPNTLFLQNFENRGTIRAAAGAGLQTTAQFNQPRSTWTNFGTIHVEGGGQLLLTGVYQNSG